MKVKVKINNAVIKKVKDAMNEALVETADALLSDLVKSQTMPFGKTQYGKDGKVKYKGGTLQNNQTFPDVSKKEWVRYL